MAGRLDMFPDLLRFVWASAYGCIIVVHLYHASASRGACRWWHAGHVFMAVGMMFMYLFMKPQPISILVWKIWYIVAAIGILTWVIAMLSRRRALSLLWFNLLIGMMGMVYMFIMPGAAARAWSYLFAGYFLAEAMAWASGSLDDGRSGASSRLIIGARSTASDGPAILVGRTTLITRVSLSAMAVGMTYMLIGMQLRQ